jgi:hypothetical protein
VANRRFRPICQVTKVPFKRRNAKIILCWIFYSYIYINFNIVPSHESGVSEVECNILL